MPEEIESPVERLSEEIHEAAEHAKESWLKWSALLSAILAVMAALAGLESAHYANDAMIAQIQASDQWSYYQAKGVKAILAESEQNILTQLGKPPPDGEAKLAKYRGEQAAIKTQAEQLTTEAKQHLEKHEMLSRAVTMCQVAIAIVAIAVLTRRRRFVLVSVAFGIGGFGFLLTGLLMS